MKTDYEKLREEQIAKLGKNKKLLLHACCAPCSTACLERVVNDFDTAVYFYNPNMDTEEEYLKRAEEERRFLKEAYNGSVGLIEEEYRGEDFRAMAKGEENAPEGGSRCAKCFALRLGQTAKYAKEHSFDCISTTLTVSPYKNAPLLNEIGEKAAKACGVEWIYCDFKKKNGFLRSAELSAKYGLYRQNYCGCVYSKKRAGGTRDSEKND